MPEHHSSINDNDIKQLFEQDAPLESPADLDLRIYAAAAGAVKTSKFKNLQGLYREQSTWWKSGVMVVTVAFVGLMIPMLSKQNYFSTYSAPSESFKTNDLAHEEIAQETAVTFSNSSQPQSVLPMAVEFESKKFSSSGDLANSIASDQLKELTTDSTESDNVSRFSTSKRDFRSSPKAWKQAIQSLRDAGMTERALKEMELFKVVFPAAAKSLNNTNE